MSNERKIKKVSELFETIQKLDAALTDNDIVMSFLKGLKNEWKDKVIDNVMPTDEKYDLREDMLTRLFDEIEHWEKG